MLLAPNRRRTRNRASSVKRVLAARLLGSLPPVLFDEDEGLAEALERDAELEANPSAGLSLEQLDQRLSVDGPANSSR